MRSTGKESRENCNTQNNDNQGTDPQITTIILPPYAYGLIQTLGFAQSDTTERYWAQESANADAIFHMHDFLKENNPGTQWGYLEVRKDAKKVVKVLAGTADYTTLTTKSQHKLYLSIINNKLTTVDKEIFKKIEQATLAINSILEDANLNVEDMQLLAKEYTIMYGIVGSGELNNQNILILEEVGKKVENLTNVINLKKNFSLTSNQIDLLKGNSSITSNLTKFIEGKENNKVKPLVNAITQFGIENNSSATSVQMINDLLTSLNNDTVFDVEPYLNPNANPNIEGSIVTCCDEPWNPSPDPELILAFGADLFHDGSDALKSMLLASYEFWITDKFEGRFVRKVFKMKGIDVPSDITDEVLGDLYSIRYDNSEFAILHEIGLGQNFIDLGFNLLDVVTIISPSKGGGAYLAVNGGGKK